MHRRTALHLAAALCLAAAIARPAAAEAPAGPMRVAVDATDLDRRVLRVQQTIPLDAQAGARRLALRYARYLPGGHGPYGDVTRLAGLDIRAGADRLRWQRDSADPFTFLVDVPAHTAALELSFHYLAPVAGSSERASVTRGLLGVEWETVLLYPAGPAVHTLRVQPRLKLPAGWQQVSALRAPEGGPAQAGPDGWLRYRELSVETFVDSPLFAAPHARVVPLDAPGAAQPVVLSVLSDEPGALKASEPQLAAHRALVRQADALFGGARPFRQYDLMLALSEQFGGMGLEHHESSENALGTDYFRDWPDAIRGRELLAHEYVHAWNGKHRRPADLATPDYHLPMGNRLLWVYEGLTEYWGHVLAARAGLTTPDQARDRLAQVVAEYAARSGRAWRPLRDTTNDPALGPGPHREWEDWQRSFDYYSEAQLVWLEADLLLRQLSGGKRSLDDFARAFFGTPVARRADGAPAPTPYTEDEVYAALNAVQPHDWRAFFAARLDAPDAPAQWLRASGWRLAWVGEEGDFQANERGWEGENGDERPQNLAFSLGLRVTGDGKLTEVFWDGPAFHAGLTKGMTIVAVNGRAHKPERLEDAIRAAADTAVPRTPLNLLVKDGEHYRTVVVDWRGGLRYPALERVGSEPDRLGAIYRPR